ncbi:MAG: aldo/keto reductase [Planctomycetes bacterium]|nr:aldo/keto reductase [Planctomycetota bacterium]
MEHRPLGSTGLQVSALGFGTASLGDVFGAIDEREGAATVRAAIDRGIDYFDTAPLYGFGLAEERLGRALAGRRDEIVLATKCCRDTFEAFDFSAQRVAASCEESLRRLRTDRIDVFQIHDVEFGTREQVLHEALPAAQRLKEQGKVRFVGLTGLPVRYLRLLAEQAELDTVLSWAHCNLLADGLETELVPLARARGLGLISASPLLQGLLTDHPPPPWHRSPPDVIAAVPALAALCREHGTTLSDVAIRHAIGRPGPATTVVGMATRAELDANLRAVGRPIPDGLLPRLEALAAPWKNRLWFEGRPENDIPATTS